LLLPSISKHEQACTALFVVVLTTYWPVSPNSSMSNSTATRAKHGTSNDFSESVDSRHVYCNGRISFVRLMAMAIVRLARTLHLSSRFPHSRQAFCLVTILAAGLVIVFVVGKDIAQGALPVGGVPKCKNPSRALLSQASSTTPHSRSR
jgi:hypothetical protein